MLKTKTTNRKSVALGIYPHPKAIGFALMDSPTTIKESGYCYSSAKNKESYVRHIANMIRLHKPTVIILEHKDSRNQHRLNQMKYIFEEIEKVVHQLDYPLVQYSRKKIRTVFGNANKPEIAEALSEKFTDYKSRLPKKRQFDSAESTKMCEFDALSLVYTHFHHEQQKLSMLGGGTS